MIDASRRTIWNGEPGTVWTNDTARVAYQLLCDWANTCGMCAQYDHAIGPWWGIPLHDGCNCEQHAIKPGNRAKPFVDYRQIIDDLPYDQQVKVVGASNYRLLKEGLITWADVVTPSRVRDLREVVATKKLTVKQMVAAGVKPRYAEEAYRTVHTPEHELVEARRRELLEKIKGAGVNQETLARELATSLASRVTIASNPSYSAPEGVIQRLPGIGTSHVGEMKRLLNALKPELLKGGMIAKPKPQTQPATQPATSATPTAKQPTFEEALEKAIADADQARANLTGADATAAVKQATAAFLKAIEDFSVAGPTGAFHGMSTAEIFRRVTWKGLDLYFDPANPAPVATTLKTLIKTSHQCPDRLLKATEGIYFTAQSNKKDSYWQQRYTNFTVSAHTGGDGRIVSYGNRSVGLGSLAHESGHNLATKLYGSTDPSTGQNDFASVIKGKEPAVSTYALNSPAEDFAEACRLYVEDHDRMKRDFPERFKVIDRIMKEPKYGG